MARENWSPSFKSHFNRVLTLVKTTPRQYWPEAVESIRDPEIRKLTQDWAKAMDRRFPGRNASEWDADDSNTRTRASRQVKATPTKSIEHRRSTRFGDAPNNASYEESDDVYDTEDSQHPDLLFQKGYVDEHPDEGWTHVGAGWWSRDVNSNRKPVDSDRRRISGASNATKSFGTGAAQNLQSNATVRREDLHNYPGIVFHHKGNGWYRVGLAPNGRKGSIRISADGEHVSYRPDHDDGAEDEDDEDDGDGPGELALLAPDATVDKAFTQRHPYVEWIHRGQGRWKLKSSVYGSAIGAVTPAPSSERRSSKVDNIFLTKDYAESHASEDLGLRRTSSRTVATKRTSRTYFDSIDNDTELFDKSYVDAHPDEEFHHRGQGRYKRGPRPKLADSESIPEPEERLVDSAYVKSHPEETFHHRGQGKWARGPPKQGASSKIAVRGPGAAGKMSSRTGEENEEGDKPPPISALLRKDEGPARWPHLNWIYRGGGKWCRQTKEEAENLTNASGMRKPRILLRRTKDGPEAQLQREARAAESALRKPGPGGFFKKHRTQRLVQTSKLSSYTESKAPTPRPALLPPEEDQLTEGDLPSLYKDEWSDDDFDDIDTPGQLLRRDYAPIIGPEQLVKALTKHDPAVRSLDSLKQLAANAQLALKQLQDEYLELDVIVAQHPMNGKKERKPVKGGRQVTDHTTWEDKKEATLYDYSFDPRRVGYQDPDAQAIVRDAEGRELRRRRGRGRADPHHTAVDYGDGEMTTKRTVKPVSRFDGVVIPPPRKRSRLMNAEDETPTPDIVNGDLTPVVTPDRVSTPNGFTLTQEDFKQLPRSARGRKKTRVEELRNQSVNSARSSESGSPKPSGVRKGRPPGSKNLHKRKDAGIKKGPRKPKIASQSASTSVEPEAAPGAVPTIVTNPPGNMSSAAAMGETAA